MSSTMPFRRTKIVCTLGPATSDEGGIERLLAAGMDVVRLNFSHGHREEHRATIRRVREVAARLGREVGILQDLGGPKIRLGRLAVEERLLEPGERLRLVTGEAAEGPDLPVNYEHLLEDVAHGDSILLADGLVELEVLERSADALECVVVVGGPVSSRKGVNLPGSTLRVPAFTDKDRLDLAVGLEEGVDFVALSFVRHERDLEPVHQCLAGSVQRPLVIAKIEKPQAVERLKQILAAVDGVMVARGDLGVEMPVVEVPLIQKRVIREARRAARPVITATQMLRSMVSSPRPTRAEATDVANAVLDGTDAVMLSEESAVGSYPVEAVEILDRIARRVEREYDTRDLLLEPPSELLRDAEATAISRSACLVARDLDARLIVATTVSGSTARLLARLRPPVPVAALTPELAVRRQLTLSWGVLPATSPTFVDTDTLFDLVRSACRQQGLARPGDRVVITAGLPLAVRGTTNLIRVIEV